MIRKIEIIFLLLLLAAPRVASAAMGPFASKTDEELKIVVEGRLVYRDDDPAQSFLLHGRDGKTYYITGSLKEQVAKILVEMGQNNIVSLEGRYGASPFIKCTTNQSYGTDQKLQVSNECLRIYELVVTKILTMGQSTETMPPPIRDAAMEAQQLKLIERQNEGLTETIGQARGTIASVNMRSPIKSIELAYKDKDGLPLKRTMLITNGTGIVKENPEHPKQPMPMSVEGLRVGQKIHVIYTFDSNKGESKAVGITVLSESRSK